MGAVVPVVPGGRDVGGVGRRRIVGQRGGPGRRRLRRSATTWTPSARPGRSRRAAPAWSPVRTVQPSEKVDSPNGAQPAAPPRTAGPSRSPSRASRTSSPEASRDRAHRPSSAFDFPLPLRPTIKVNGSSGSTASGKLLKRGEPDLLDDRRLHRAHPFTLPGGPSRPWPSFRPLGQAHELRPRGHQGVEIERLGRPAVAGWRRRATGPGHVPRHRIAGTCGAGRRPPARRRPT